jgi:hypothetical protein
VLEQLGVVDADARQILGPWGRRTVRNYRGTATGEIRPAVVLDARHPQRSALSDA